MYTHIVLHHSPSPNINGAIDLPVLFSLISWTCRWCHSKVVIVGAIGAALRTKKRPEYELCAHDELWDAWCGGDIFGEDMVGRIGKTKEMPMLKGWGCRISAAVANSVSTRHPKGRFFGKQHVNSCLENHGFSPQICHKAIELHTQTRSKKSTDRWCVWFVNCCGRSFLRRPLWCFHLPRELNLGTSFVLSAVQTENYLQLSHTTVP